MVLTDVSLPEVKTKQYQLEVLTEDYLLQCEAEPVGMLMSYMVAYACSKNGIRNNAVIINRKLNLLYFNIGKETQNTNTNTKHKYNHKYITVI